MKKTMIIIKKELYRVLGDRKMLFSLYILPALLVIAIYSLMGMMISNMQSDIEEHVSKVAFVNAPESFKSVINALDYEKNAEVDWVSSDKYASSEQEMRDDILAGKLDLMVYFEQNFDGFVADYQQPGDKIPVMKIFYNSTEDYSSQAYSVFVSMVGQSYQSVLLANRFGNMDLLKVYDEETEVIFKEEKANSEFISMLLPYMIVMLLFTGVMSVGVDALAGEKERGTLASMLISPVSRRSIAAGKLISLAILSGLSSLVYSVSMIIAASNMSGGNENMIEMGFGGASFNALQIIELLAIMLALVYMYVGIVGLLATIAKDTKVAGTYISPCYIVVIMCGMLTMFTSGKEVPFYRYLIPVYGNAMAIKDICGNELSMVNFVCSLASTLVIGAILTYGVTKAFDSEKIMFNA